MTLTNTKTAPATFCLLCHFVNADIQLVARRAVRKARRERIGEVAQKQYQMPDSDHCKKALSLVTECSPEILVNHGLRSYAFAVAMAHRVRKPFDREVLFMGAIMHDLGLTDRYDCGNTFEVDGARAARSFCMDQNLSPERADLVHEMVVHHNSVGHAHKMDPEIALLHYGAGVDVAGLWLSEIHPRTLAQILENYPRQGFKQGMQALLKDQIQRKPSSYMAPFIKLGFLKKIEQAPLP